MHRKRRRSSSPRRETTSSPRKRRTTKDRDRKGTSNQESLKRELERKLFKEEADRFRPAWTMLGNLWKQFYPGANQVTPESQKLERAILDMKSDHEQLKKQVKEYKKRDGELLTLVHDRQSQITRLEGYIKTLKSAMSNRTLDVRRSFTDPLINHNYLRLENKLKDTEQKLRASHRELKAAEFSAQSSTGRQLMARCRKLQEENQELGRALETTREKELEKQLAVQLDYTRELAEALRENQNFISELCDGDLAEEETPPQEDAEEPPPPEEEGEPSKTEEAKEGEEGGG